MPRPHTVRVIAGSARGRRLQVPPGERVRPTKDRVREAVFSALASRDRLAGAVVLDCYAGSGALAIEALSRGAARALLVDRDRPAADAIAHNLTALDLDDRARVVTADVAHLLRGPVPREAPFDLVFVDPPYDAPDPDVDARLGALVQCGWLAPGALVVVERGERSLVQAPTGWQTTWERRFGDTLVAFLQVD